MKKTVRHDKDFGVTTNWLPLNSVSLAVLLLMVLPAFSAQQQKEEEKIKEKQPIRWGVFAYLGVKKTKAQYEPIVNYLNEVLQDYAVTLHVKPMQAIYEWMNLQELDFVTTNPTHYLVARRNNPLTGVMATLVPLDPQGNPIYFLAGCIITRSDRHDINCLRDIRGKTVAAPSQLHMGGYRAQAYELAMAGIRPKSYQIVETGGHQEAIRALLRHDADVAFVRSGILEEMFENVELKSEQVKLINAQEFDHFNMLASTRLYPEWPVFALPHVLDRTLRSFTSALLSLEPDHPAAVQARIHGYTIPADYLPVEDLARTLRLPPYQDHGTITLRSVVNQFWLEGLGILLVLVTLVALLLWGQISRRALKKSEKENRLLTNHAMAGIASHEIILDDNGKPVDYVFLNANSAFEKHTGLKCSEIIGRRVTQVIPGITKTSFIQIYGDVALSGTPVSFEQFSEPLNRYYQVNSYNIGERRFATVFYDITEKKKVEAELSRIKDLERFQMVAENFPDGIIVLYDKQFRLNLAKGLGLANIGLSEESIPGKKIRDIFPPEFAEKLEENITKTFSGEKQTFEITLREQTFINTMTPVRDPDGQVEQVLGIFIEITHRKRAENEKLLKEKLEKDIAIATESLRFKQNFLANMSHEMRTPLTGILGITDILAKTSLDAEQANLMGILQQSGANLREIINQVLDYSKIESGKITVNNQVFEFKALPESSVQLFKNNLNAETTITCYIDSQVPGFIEADNKRLSQVLNNLVSNAVKFTPHGSITIKCSIESTNADTREIVVKIEVTDTGIGIPKEHKDKLFIPFAQIGDNDQRHYEGTGLGLSICKQLMEIMGGQIGFESKQEKGSTFFITFPAKIANMPAPENGRHKKPDIIRSLKILLVDDKIVNQKVISLMLKKLGHMVDIVSNGLQATECFKPGKFDLILMDIQMPVMDGITATQKLKEQYDNLPPIVGLSANAFEGDREKYMALGMDEYLTKPLKKVDFTNVLSIIFNL